MTDKTQLILISLGLLFLNIALKLPFIGAGDISLDEPFTLFHAQKSIPEIFEMLKNENNPPLMFLLVHYWINWWGIEKIAVRVLPFLFSVMTAPVLFLLGRKALNNRVGIILALLFTFSNYHLFFAHEVRAYSLFALLTVLSMWAFVSLFKNKKQPGFWAILTISNTLLAYTHFFGFGVWAIQGLTVLIIPEFRKQLLKTTLFSFGGSILAYLPYLSFFWMRFSNASQKGGTWVPIPGIEELYYNLAKFANEPVPAVLLLIVLLIALVLYFNPQSKIERLAPFLKMAAIWWLVPYLGMFLISQKIPIFLDRYLVFISPGFFLCIALSVEIILQFLQNRFSINLSQAQTQINERALIKMAPWALGGLVLIPILLTTKPDLGSDRKLSEMIATLKHQQAERKSIILIYPGYTELAFAYHYDLTSFQNFTRLRPELNLKQVFPLDSPLDFPESALMDNGSSLILLDASTANRSHFETIQAKCVGIFKQHEVNETYKGYKIHYYY